LYSFDDLREGADVRVQQTFGLLIQQAVGFQLLGP
jgi:hypothetical protein